MDYAVRDAVEFFATILRIKFGVYIATDVVKMFNFLLSGNKFSRLVCILLLKRLDVVAVRNIAEGAALFRERLAVLFGPDCL